MQRASLRVGSATAPTVAILVVARIFLQSSDPITETPYVVSFAGTSRPVEVLPYGVQRMVELGIALALEPKILLLDEPAAGVPRADVGIIFAAIEKLPPSLAVLLIEHDIDVVFRFARRVAVLVSGEILVEGTPSQISEHAQVRALYLGEAGRA